MIFREIITVYCENRATHIGAVCGQNAFYKCTVSGDKSSLVFERFVRVESFRDVCLPTIA